MRRARSLFAVVVAAVTGAAVAGAAGVGSAGCHEGPAPTLPGCDRDTDCKGDRICHARACVDPPVPAPSPRGDAEVAAPDPPRPAPAPPPSPAPAPTVVPSPPAPAPAPAPGTPSTTGERRDRCGCPPDDLMCAMKCAQRGNAADPSTWPADPQP